MVLRAQGTDARRTVFHHSIFTQEAACVRVAAVMCEVAPCKDLEVWQSLWAERLASLVNSFFESEIVLLSKGQSPRVGRCLVNLSVRRLPPSIRRGTLLHNDSKKRACLLIWAFPRKIYCSMSRFCLPDHTE